MPQSHFPTRWVLYCAFLSSCAIPVMLRGIPANPETGSFGLVIVGSLFTRFTCTGKRPLWIEARVGAPPFVDVPNWAGFRDRTYVLLPPPLTAESSAPVLRPS